MANKNNMSAFMKMILEAENAAKRQYQMQSAFKGLAFRNLVSTADSGEQFEEETDTQISIDDKRDTSWGSMTDEVYAAEGVCDDHTHPDFSTGSGTLKKKAVSRTIGKINPAEMRRAVILSEILSPPVSVRNK